MEILDQPPFMPSAHDELLAATDDLDVKNFILQSQSIEYAKDGVRTRAATRGSGASRRRNSMVDTGRQSRSTDTEVRRHPRIEILGQLDGYLMTVDTPVKVLDLSLGGFGIETLRPLAAGEVHECRFTLRDGVAVILLAKVMHCRPVKGRRKATRYLAGFQFVEQADPEAQAARAQLLERVASTLPKSLKKT